jgi:hypothetical protein
VAVLSGVAAEKKWGVAVDPAQGLSALACAGAGVKIMRWMGCICRIGIVELRW